MIRKKIDYERCTKCMKCRDICVNLHVIEAKEEGFPEFKRDYNCIFCGHCLAVCPEDAISFIPQKDGVEGSFYADVIKEGKTKPPSPQETARLLYGIRSTRNFNGKEVEKETLMAVLEAMVRAPSAGNEQNRLFYILHGAEKVCLLDKEVRQAQLKRLMAVKNPILSSLVLGAMDKQIRTNREARNTILQSMSKDERLPILKRSWEEVIQKVKDAPYFFGAPAAIIVTSVDIPGSMHKDFYKPDTAIAISYGTIMARSLGLSSCWMGLAEMAINPEKSLRVKYGISSRERVNGILALGYSDTEWHTIPPRGPVKIAWIGESNEK